MIQPSRRPVIPAALNRLTAAWIVVFAVALRAAGFAWTTSLLAALGLAALTVVGFLVVYRVGLRQQARRDRPQR
jgi:Flp pilus assembly protein TadB